MRISARRLFLAKGKASAKVLRKGHAWSVSAEQSEGRVTS